MTVPVVYSPNENWRIVLVGGYKRLLEDAEDSPVVDDAGDANQFLGGLLAIYRF